MFKSLITLMRGQAATIGEEIADRHALVILDQQMRDAGATLDRAKKVLAVAIAQDSREGQRLAATRARIADLETRAVVAIRAGRDELAAEAAETIAGLETERDASAAARALFADEIARLKTHVRQQQLRLSEIERGRRTARAAEAVRTARRGRVEASSLFEGTLTEAEATLSRLRERQSAAEAADAALEALDLTTGPAVVAEKLAAEGFGPPVKPAAADVLARLRQRAVEGTSAPDA